MTQRTVLFLMLCSAALMMDWGCASTQPTQFYLLSPMITEEREAKSEIDRTGLSVGLGPIDLPAYLDRPQIVTRTTPNALDLAEFDQWAEPLRHTVTRVLTENLSLLLNTDNMVRFPWKRQSSIDYQLVMDVNQFDTKQHGDALLVARWSVVSSDGKRVIVTKKSRYTKTPRGTDYQHLVEALSGTLEDVSREIASMIIPLFEARKGMYSRQEDKRDESMVD